MNQNWAKFWLRDYWKENKKDTRPISSRYNKTKEEKKRKPRHIVKMFVLHYHKKRKLSYRKISKVLKEKHGINTSIATISRIINEEEGCKNERKSL